MMSTANAVSVAVADAVMQELRSITLTLNPVYGRTYNTDRKLKDNGTLHIDVVAAGHKLAPIARDTVARDPVVQIVVRKRLNNASRADDPPEIDRLCKLVEEIENHFAQAWLNEADAAWQACETFGPLDDDFLGEWRQFTAIIAITFRVHGD
jgi:hypothetical protein